MGKQKVFVRRSQKQARSGFKRPMSEPINLLQLAQKDLRRRFVKESAQKLKATRHVEKQNNKLENILDEEIKRLEKKLAIKRACDEITRNLDSRDSEVKALALYVDVKFVRNQL